MNSAFIHPYSPDDLGVPSQAEDFSLFSHLYLLERKSSELLFPATMAFSAYVGRLSVQNPLAFLAWMSGFLSGDVSSLWQRLIGSRSDTVRFSLRRWSACVWLPLASTAAVG
ncbi:unnamed protein product [Arabidopsis lyrata]|nr:unnamed protein product [Arabidopsis lyrata]